MKVKVFLILIISILGFNLFAQLIPDDNFKARINQNLGQPPEYEPTIEDLNGITGTLWAAVAGISSIEGAQYLINVTSLELYFNQINDISPISNLTNLTDLILRDNQIEDISAVSGLANLTSLNLEENQINDISPVSELFNLTSLNLDENQISVISAVSGLTNLTSLNLTENQINDISAVSNLINLTYLQLSSNQISDIFAVSGLTSLESLQIGSNQISDISDVSDLINLTSFGLSSNQIVDISAVSGLINLTTFNSDLNQINDISAVSGLTNLTGLLLRANQISDISPVSNLTSLIYLYLNSNQINEISAVSDLINLNHLDLAFNQISDIFALVENTGLGSGDTVFLIDNPLSQEAIEVHMPILEDREFNALIYSSTPNIYAACYPNPTRNEINVSPNTTLEWSGNFPTREVTYDVWLGETSENLLNVGAGTAINNTLYSFTPNLNGDTDYWWRVRAITETDTIWSGLWSFSTGEQVSIEDDLNSSNPSQRLNNYPNPFNPVTNINYNLPTLGKVELSVYNIKGQIVKILVNETQVSGEHSVVWNGTNTNNKRVSSGAYFYKLEINDSNLLINKMLLLK